LLSTALSLAFVLLILDQNRRTFRYGWRKKFVFPSTTPILPNDCFYVSPSGDAKVNPFPLLS
jgi:hypothetical protein